MTASAVAAIPEIRLRKVSKTYRRGGVPVPALHGIDVEIAPGEFDWEDYDRQLDLAAENGIKTIIAEFVTSAP